MSKEKTNPKEEKIEKTTDQLAEKKKQEQSEMHHLPTEGKKPGEIEDFKKSANNNEEE